MTIILASAIIFLAVFVLAVLVGVPTVIFAFWLYLKRKEKKLKQ